MTFIIPHTQHAPIDGLSDGFRKEIWEAMSLTPEELRAQQTPTPSEFMRVIEEHFWDLV